MRMKRQFLILTAILGFGFLLSIAGCGDSTQTTENQPSTAPAAATGTEDGAQEADGGTAPEGSFKTSKGTFKEISWGDYAHFILVNEKGEEEDFWIANDLPTETVEKYESNKAKGNKIEIKWRTVRRNIPEAGGEMEINEVFEVREL